MVNVAGAVLCPHPASRSAEPGEANLTRHDGPRTTVYVDGGKGTMGLCLRCLGGMQALAARGANLGEVVAEFASLGYTRQDAARFHADMARGPLRLWRRATNPVLARLVRLAPQEASA